MLNQASSFSRWATALVACSAAALLTSAAEAQSVSAPLNVTTFAGTAGERQATNGTGTAARFFAPSGIIVDASGNLIIADTCNNIFRKITPEGVVTTFSGTPPDPTSRPHNAGSADGAANEASFHIGDSASAGGVWGEPIYTSVGSNTLGRDSSGNIYFADTINNTIRKITPAGVVSTLAGAAGGSGADDGSQGAARFLSPSGVAVDSAGNIYVADAGNNTIRKITPAGLVSTFAGTAGTFGASDGTGTSARFSNPSGVVIDGAGNLYVTEKGNHTVRKITPAAVVTTLAGSGGVSGDSDGSGANARFMQPRGITIDSSGNLYVADTGNHAIRKISPAGTVSTVAGSKGTQGSVDGSGTAARFFEPCGITIDSAGVLYISDTNNNTIRRGAVAGGSGNLEITGIPPSRIQAAAGSNVTLKVVATGSPTPTYQWSKDGVAISGATNATLTLTAVTSANQGNYSVLVASNLLTFSSAQTQVQVLSGTSVPSVVIVTQPTDRTAAAGQSVNFTVEAASSQAMTYQWAKNGTAIVGATSATYTIASAQTAHAGTYTVAVTDGQSTATTGPAMLTVTGGTGSAAPSITSQPASKTVDRGTTVTFSVAASGTPSPTFQWQKEGATLANSSTISGVTTSTLTITEVSASDAGNYTVVATNSAGSALSEVAKLTVNGAPAAVAPAITAQPAPASANAGGTVSFSVVATGTPAPTFQWQKNGSSISNGGTVSGATTATLTLTGVTTADAGNYSVVVTNSAGSATSSAAALTVSSSGGPTAWLVNVSVRTTMLAGQGPLIVGFNVVGGPKQILVRGIGPRLIDFGVPASEALADPKLELHPNNQSAPTLVNDNWDAALDALMKSLTWNLVAGSKDAAFAGNLEGMHSVWEVPTGPGLVLVEAWDAAPHVSSPRISNISARNRVGTGDNVLIAGFAIRGTGKKKLIIRAVGARLADYGVGDALADPILEIWEGSTKRADNDNWDAQRASEINIGGLALIPGSKDAALVIELEASESGRSYTAVCKGVNNTTGEALVEVYEAP